MTSRFSRGLTASLIAIGTLVALALVPTPSAAAATGPDCREVRAQVALTPGLPRDQLIVGELCGTGDVVHVLVSGGAYGSVYWDFPYQPERYSYVAATAGSDITTFNFDRLGIGRSSHPFSALVTIPTHVYVIHQLIEGLRSGDYGRAFAKVVLVGHSIGSAISYGVAANYPSDVDGLIITGLAHVLNVADVLQVALDLHPARNDGGAWADLDPGYLAAGPEGRKVAYYLPTADPQVIAADYATAETSTVTEFGGLPIAMVDSLRVTQPVFVVVGEHDAVSCAVVPCSSPLSGFNAERLSFPLAASYRSAVVPATGHNLNLHPSAPGSFALINAWSRQHMG